MLPRLRTIAFVGVLATCGLLLNGGRANAQIVVNTPGLSLGLGTPYAGGYYGGYPGVYAAPVYPGYYGAYPVRPYPYYGYGRPGYYGGYRPAYGYRGGYRGGYRR